MLINIILYTSNINQTVKVSEKVDVLEDYLDSLEISGIKKLWVTSLIAIPVSNDNYQTLCFSI